MIDIIKDCILYATENKYRLLIEETPSMLYVYADEFNIADIADRLKGVLKKKNFISTFFQVEYNLKPEYVYFEVEKLKLARRFWSQKEFELIELDDRDIYFIDMSTPFTVEEKAVLSEFTKDLKMSYNFESMVFLIRDFIEKKQIDNIRFNLYNNFGIIFYK